MKVRIYNKGVLEGFNGTILAYGQTSSGKTFTMQGVADNPEYEGIIPRIVKYIFNKVEQIRSEEISYTVKISMVELYNEKFKDLTNPNKNNLQVREDKTKGVYIEDLTEHSVEDTDSVFDLITKALSQLGEVKVVDLELENSGRFNYGSIGPDKTPVITLPGDPISAYVAMQLFVRPMIRTMLGAKEVYCPSVKARLEKDFNGSNTGRNYLLALLSDDNSSVSIFNEQEDFVSLAAANSLVSVNAGDGLKAGDSVTTVILPRIK